MSDDQEPFRSLLLNIVEYAKELADELKAKKDEGLSDQDIGRQMAIYSILSTIRNEAPHFGVPLELIGLASYNPDLDLL
jgi:hypothetical protein